MAEKHPLDSRAAVGLIQRQVCGAEIATRVLQDNPEHGIRAGDLLMFNRRGDEFRCSGLIRGFAPDEALMVSQAYASAVSALYPPPPRRGEPA